MRQQSFRLDLACASQEGGGKRAGQRRRSKKISSKFNNRLHGTFRKLGYLVLGIIRILLFSILY